VNDDIPGEQQKEPIIKQGDEILKSASFASGFSSWDHAMRFLAVCLILLLSVGALVYFLFRLTDIYQVELKGDALTIYSGKDKAISFLPSNVVWLNTGIKLDKKSQVDVVADGQVHLAIHYIVESAKNDSRVQYPWASPQGQGIPSTVKEQVPGDVTRDGQLICPSAPYGTLLAYVGPQDLDKDNPWPTDQPIQIIGNSGAIKNYTDSKQSVWLVVNDSILDASESSRKAYLLDEDTCDLAERYDGYDTACDPQALIDAKKRWSKIKEDDYWNIWFDDNVGSFIVKFKLDGDSENAVNQCVKTRAQYLEEVTKASDIEVKLVPKTEHFETDDLNEVFFRAEQLADRYGPNKILVVFDLDNTLLAMENTLGSDQWYEWQNSLSSDDTMKVPSLLDAQLALYHNGAMRLTQHDGSDVVARLKNEGFQLLALTARGKETRLVTFRELRRQNISFQNNILGSDIGARLEYISQNVRDRPILYEDHVVFSAGQDKGIVLTDILARNDVNVPSAIIFVDDKQRNIDNVTNAFAGSSITLSTYRYSREDPKVYKFKGKSTVSDWCRLEENLIENQQLLGKINYSLPPGKRTTTCTE